MNQAEEFCSSLERQVGTEARHGWENARKRWGKPLPERVLAGRAIGGLRVSEVETSHSGKLIHFHPSAEDMRAYTPESVVPASFVARTPLDRHTAPALPPGFLDFDQESCMKNDLELLPQQEELVAATPAAVRLVTGVAGSGKSLVLLFRASFRGHQREEMWELFRAYQNLLRSHGATDWHNIALRFHQAAVVGKSLAFPCYDAVFVDEAQFFAKAWFEIVSAALKPGGHLFLAADPTRMLFMGFTRAGQRLVALRTAAQRGQPACPGIGS